MVGRFAKPDLREQGDRDHRKGCHQAVTPILAVLAEQRRCAPQSTWASPPFPASLSLPFRLALYSPSLSSACLSLGGFASWRETLPLLSFAASWRETLLFRFASERLRATIPLQRVCAENALAFSFVPRIITPSAAGRTRNSSPPLS